MMSSINEYRQIAKTCLYKANTVDDERDKPLWITLAQSWLKLADHAARREQELRAGQAADDTAQREPELTDAAS